MREFKVQTEASITDQDIADIVVTAFEGGSAYWCPTAEPVERDEHGDWRGMPHQRLKEFEHDGYPVYSNPEFWYNDSRGYQLKNDEGEVIKKVLTLSGILKALKYQPPHQKGVSDNWFRHVVSQFVSGDYDAGDADCIVQVATLGEVVYG